MLFRSILASYTERTQQPEVPEEYIISNDVHENLLKAKIILKKALFSISQARASISKSDKTCLCDKDYGDNTTHNLDELPTKTSTCEAKYKKLKSLKEKIFAHKKESQSDSVSNLIADLHVELIYLFHKISMRLLGLNREYNLEQMKPKHGTYFTDYLVHQHHNKLLCSIFEKPKKNSKKSLISYLKAVEETRSQSRCYCCPRHHSSTS